MCISLSLKLLMQNALSFMLFHGYEAFSDWVNPEFISLATQDEMKILIHTHKKFKI